MIAESSVQGLKRLFSARLQIEHDDQQTRQCGQRFQHHLTGVLDRPRVQRQHQSGERIDQRQHQYFQRAEDGVRRADVIEMRLRQ